MNSSSDKNFVEEGATRPRICESHGEFVSKAFSIFRGDAFWTKCPRCEEERKRVETLEREEDERRQREGEIRSMLAAAHFPRRHLDKGFAGFDAKTKEQKSALSIARRYAESIVDKTCKSGASLVLIGRPGTGKTHLATAIGETLASNLHHVKYTTVASLMQRLRASYARGADETEDEIVNELRSTWLLILDEVGTDRPSEHDLRVLQDLVDFRYRELRRTVFISNLPMNELAENLGERIVDRLREMATIVAFNWASHRAV